MRGDENQVVNYARNQTTDFILVVAEVLEKASELRGQIADMVNQITGWPYEWKEFPGMSVFAEFHGQIEDFRTYLENYLVTTLTEANKKE